MECTQVFLIFVLFIYAHASAFVLPAPYGLPELHDRVPLKTSTNPNPFTRSETVFGIAKGLAGRQARRALATPRSQLIAGHRITHDLVSTQFRSFDTTFSISVNGGIWGYNRNPGYYRFANGTASNDTSIVNIGNDIASLKPKELTSHVVESIQGLNNLTYPYLGVKVCGEALSLRQVLDPLRQNQSMTVSISNTPTGVGMSLDTGAQATLQTGTDSIPVSALTFITIVNNGILERISDMGQIGYVDTLVIEIYLAIGYRIAEQVHRLVDGDCVTPEEMLAGMNSLSENFESLLRPKIDVAALEEL